MRGRRTWLNVVVLAGLGALLLPLACGDLREDEFQCEQAVAHLASCCPSFDPRKVTCEYATGCGSTTFPSLSVADSECIEAKTCAAIVTGMVCETVATLKSVVVDDDGGVVSNHEEVCR